MIVRRAFPSILVAAAIAAGSMYPAGRLHASSSPLRIGALYPLSGPQAEGGKDEFHGVQTAARLINARGGVHGRPVQFVVRDAPSADAGPAAVDALKRSGV